MIKVSAMENLTVNHINVVDHMSTYATVDAINRLSQTNKTMHTKIMTSNSPNLRKIQFYVHINNLMKSKYGNGWECDQSGNKFHPEYICITLTTLSSASSFGEIMAFMKNPHRFRDNKDLGLYHIELHYPWTSKIRKYDSETDMINDDNVWNVVTARPHTVYKFDFTRSKYHKKSE
jgi:hypothetical protein